MKKGKNNHGVFFLGLEDMAHCVYMTPRSPCRPFEGHWKIHLRRSREIPNGSNWACLIRLFLLYLLVISPQSLPFFSLFWSSSSIGLLTDTILGSYSLHLLSHFIPPQLQSLTAPLLFHLSTKQQCRILPVPKEIVLAAGPAGKTNSRVSHWNAWSSLSSPKFLPNDNNTWLTIYRSLYTY